MATRAYDNYGIPIAPSDPDQEYMTVQETAYVLKCSVSWLRRLLVKQPDLCGRNGSRGRIITDRKQRTAIHAVRSAGDPRTGKSRPSSRRRPATT
ncbi:DNA-binding protein [Streptomyces aureocirculatus]|uniref:DNA-binding protein n=1 Tax=Streptomyces aureocirculatus TaxID=67275 RepID=UPI000AECB9A5|nr:DNA-binding protein [Streptomyces aureocirculatus]